MLRSVLIVFLFSLLKDPPLCPPWWLSVFIFPASGEEGSLVSTASAAFMVVELWTVALLMGAT